MSKMRKEVRNTETEKRSEKSHRQGQGGIFEGICDEIMEFQTTGRCDIKYIKTKELRWKQNHGIQNNGIEGSQGYIIVDQRQVQVKFGRNPSILHSSAIDLIDQKT
jgi:hypothetical protein